LRIHPQQPLKLFDTVFQLNNLRFQVFNIGVFVHALVIGQRTVFLKFMSVTRNWVNAYLWGVICVLRLSPPQADAML
jgi:hypothetical protein